MARPRWGRDFKNKLSDVHVPHVGSAHGARFMDYVSNVVIVVLSLSETARAIRLLCGREKHDGSLIFTVRLFSAD